MSEQAGRVTRSEADDLSTVLLRAGVSFAKRHYVLSSFYVVGVVVMLFATGWAVTPEQEQSYQRILSEIDSARIDKAQNAVWGWEQRYRDSKGWFSCDEVCTDNYEALQAARADLESVEAEFRAIMTRAKQEVGLFSEYGVQEVRDLFWSQFAGGRDFAKRSSWYDLIFMSISAMGRDESLLEFAIRFLMQMLINFTLGLIGALIGFYWFLWSIIASYEPNFLIGFAMFMLGSVAATSFVTTYLLGLYGAAAGSVYTAVKLGGQSAARMQDQARRQQAFLRYQQQQQRAHQD